MTTEKILGRISRAEFGTVNDYPFLLGLELYFSLRGGGSGVGSSSRYMVNISPECKWSPQERLIGVTKMVDQIDAILRAAKVNSVSELRDVPVEVTLEGGCFKDFRVLTEVL